VADTKPQAEATAGSPISDKAKRRINTLAENKLLTSELMKNTEKGLFSVVQTDPQAAYDFSVEQAGKDWEDQNYKKNFQKIADHIKKEWP
jgi:hypothetical protein